MGGGLGNKSVPTATGGVGQCLKQYQRDVFSPGNSGVVGSTLASASLVPPPWVPWVAPWLASLGSRSTLAPWVASLGPWPTLAPLVSLRGVVRQCDQQRERGIFASGCRRLVGPTLASALLGPALAPWIPWLAPRLVSLGAWSSLAPLVCF